MQNLILPPTLSIHIDSSESLTKFACFRTAVFLLSVCLIFIINSYCKELVHALLKEFKSMVIQNCHSIINTGRCGSVVLG